MSNVYLALKRSVGIILLFFSHAVLAQPVINSFSPTSGPVGTSVTITGTGFNTLSDSNIVYFGAVRATLQSVSATSLTVTVPAGATYAPITVTSNRLTAYSRLAFTVTFAYGHTPFDSTAFTRQADLTGLGNPRNIAIADFNRDGRADLMVTNQSSNVVSVYRNNGTPGGPVKLVLYRNIPQGSQPFGIATGDLNGDGRLDAAVTSFGSNTVTVYTNKSINDTIRFDTTTYVCGSNSVGVAIADVDGDGKPDLVTTSSNSGLISVFRNTTTGFAVTFAAKVDFSTFDRADEVAIGDLDNDGKPEVVTANFLGTISVWKNLSSPGSISLSKTNYTAGSYPGNIAIADLNGDGKPDIVFSHYGSHFLSVYRNISTAGSISLDVRKDFTTGPQSRGISIGDLNGDGKADVAVVSDSIYVLTLLQNASSGDSILLNNRYDFSLGAGPTGVAIGDLNNDGKPDITATNSYSKVSIFRNTQTGPVPVITSFTPTSAHKGTGVTIFGSHFTGATAVSFGGVLADSIVFVTDTAIRAIVDTGATGNVSVTTPYGTATKPGFTFIRDTIPDTTAAPVITSFTPTSGSKGTKVFILGSKFTNANAVSFGGVPADSITFKNDTLIIAIVDTGATGNVSVTTPYGTATKSGFTFIKDTIPDTTAAPVITSFTPTSGRKGTKVFILGSKFTNANAVSFGGIPADSITFKNDTLIIAIVDTGATGNVSVTTPLGTASKAGFTFIKDSTSIPDTTTVPVITNFTPTFGQKGTVVTIFGKHLTGVNQVQFGGIPADSIWHYSDTVIKARVDTGGTGAVCVFAPTGSACKAGFTFVGDSTITDTLFVNTRAGINNNTTLTTAKAFRMYPNPASHYVVWQQPATDHRTSLQLIDISGRIVRKMVVASNATQTTVQVGELHAGVYKLVWSDGNKKLTHTLLIQ
ncbi:hypothetical protein A3860_00340 [Niastella vici]|uniref:IPT/TIG domain-containing protein n=1 Tax=Niastella vici TaxID=1703345 RepID=A0A1V9G8A7_9BACT|nr:FG-GAP-like repeat-containing protein [Niastella vici]OQP66853.1 hypothetical protein A3860_00340 [Niastella vici]